MLLFESHSWLEWDSNIPVQLLYTLFQAQVMLKYKRMGSSPCPEVNYQRLGRDVSRLPCHILVLFWPYPVETTRGSVQLIPEPSLARLEVHQEFHQFDGSGIRFIVGAETQTPSCPPNPYYPTLFIWPLKLNLCSPNS